MINVKRFTYILHFCGFVFNIRISYNTELYKRETYKKSKERIGDEKNEKEQISKSSYS